MLANNDSFIIDMADADLNAVDAAVHAPAIDGAATAMAAAVAATVATVGMKLPDFWDGNPQFWFRQAESQFVISKITTEVTKFHYVVRSLNHTTVSRVSPQVDNPRAGHEYEDLKAALLKAYGKSRRERAAMLANMGGLGSRRPSHLLSDMRMLLGTEPADHMLFEHHFLANLPDDIRITLSQLEGTIDVLAAAADKMWQEKLLSQPVITVAAVSGNQPTAKPAKSPFCHFHRKFGKAARKCEGECSFPKSGNASASQ